MSEKIKIDQLGAAIAASLNAYVTATETQVEEAVAKVGKDTAKVVATAGTYKDGPGGYRDSITFEKLKGKKHVATGVVHAGKEHYRLTHLLEHGHALKNGDRTNAFPHFEPGERYAEEQLIKELEQKLGG